MRPSTIIAIVLGVLLGTSGPAKAGDTNCVSLDIHVKSDTVKGNQRCTTGQFGHVDDGVGLTEFIEVKGTDFVMFLHHVEAGMRSYLTQRGFEDVLADGSNFERVEDLKVYTAGKGYSVRKFTGVTAGDKSYPCFGLMRYSGTAFSGPRHLVFGFYCEFSGNEVDDDRIDDVMAAIDTDF